MLFGRQGVGETLRGTLNNTIDRRYGNQQARDKNEAAINAGRYEIENRHLYRPEDDQQAEDQQRRAWEQHEQLQSSHNLTSQTPAHFMPGTFPHEEHSNRDSWGTFGAPEKIPGAAKLGSFFDKAAVRLGSRDNINVEQEPQAPKERGRLRKRSSSMLGVVQE